MNTLFRSALPLLCMAPSVLFGAFVMHHSGVPSSLWLQNLVVYTVVGISSFVILYKKIRPDISGILAMLIAGILLLLTFIDSGVDGVHRWLTIGPIRFLAGSIVLPVLIIELGKVVKSKILWLTVLLAFGIMLLLVLQPDASHATAFALAAMYLLYKHASKPIHYVVLILCIAAPAYAWYFIDNLAPVVYVEDILQMAGDMGPIWYVIGVFSLVLLPLPFFLLGSGAGKHTAIGLGLYISGVLFSTLFGDFPVPLMGFGMSPILGYGIAITWLVSISREGEMVKDSYAL